MLSSEQNILSWLIFPSFGLKIVNDTHSMSFLDLFPLIKGSWLLVPHVAVVAWHTMKYTGANKQQ